MAGETPTYELFYWPTIQGRGEFVRLVFEEAGPEEWRWRRPECAVHDLAARLQLLDAPLQRHPAVQGVRRRRRRTREECP